MNQILNEWDPSISDHKSSSKLNPFVLKGIFIFSIFIIISCIFYFIHGVYRDHKNQKLSKQMLNHFSVTTLYSDSSDYTTDISLVSDAPFVIGMISISKINVHYPILSEMTDENLKIAPCRFFGPMPNEVGNLCIAGHNYKNDQFFSKLDVLEINDVIDIYDTDGKKISYLVYQKYIADLTSLECTSQITNGEKQITLVTCNKPDNSKRIIVKAKEKK